MNDDVLYEAPEVVEVFDKYGWSASVSKKTCLGKLKLHEITYKEIDAYIEERLKQVSKITVRKEISVLSGFYRECKHIRTISRKAVEGLGNPTKEINPKFFKKTYNQKKAKRIDDENFEKYLNCIYCEDFDFAYISLLQYFGAFRMSEALSLTWENIDFKKKTINLPQTKTLPRTVLMTKDLEDLLDTIEPLEVKRQGIVVKTQTLFKYQKQIQRFRKKYGFELRTHQFRKDSISRMIDNIGGNKILLAQILGYKNVKQFASDYIEEKPSIDTLEDVMKNVGHTPSSINITSNNYYEPKLD